MHKPRIYIDTSVIGGCHDEEFSEWSNLLMENFRKKIMIPVISDVVREELEGAPNNVQEVLRTLPNIENAEITKETEELAKLYIDEGAVTEKSFDDAHHIAIASIWKVDLLVSWNFKHIVNIDRIHSFHAVNIKYGYPLIEIRNPRDVVHEK